MYNNSKSHNNHKTIIIQQYKHHYKLPISTILQITLTINNHPHPNLHLKMINNKIHNYKIKMISLILLNTHHKTNTSSVTHYCTYSIHKICQIIQKPMSPNSIHYMSNIANLHKKKSKALETPGMYPYHQKLTFYVILLKI